MPFMCQYNIEKECNFDYEGRHGDKCVACALTEAQKLHPYRIVGNTDSFLKYAEGWNDALDFIADRLKIEW